MKMFLTRMGRRWKMVVAGDITQTDLPRGKLSGLIDARDRLSGVDGIAFCTLGREDIVRHELVQRIVDAYDAGDEQDGRRGANGHGNGAGGGAGAGGRAAAEEAPSAAEDE